MFNKGVAVSLGSTCLEDPGLSPLAKNGEPSTETRVTT